jgi:RNA polymerase sigma factor (TIGR02999 family)
MDLDLREKASVTALLRQWGEGDREAFDRLTDMVYGNLRQLAGRGLRLLPADSSIQATALVNEVYIRLVDADRVAWRDRAHFFAIAARLMRQIAADSARFQGRATRGAGWQRIALDDSDIPSSGHGPDILALDVALNRLTAIDARKAQVVELRFFGGLNNHEIAEVLQVSVDTIKRDWSFARLWLAREIGN